MTTILSANQVNDLCLFIESQIKKSGCNHSLAYTLVWAEKEKINKDDLIDVLEENGGYCDCEVAMNLPENCDLILKSEIKVLDLKNPFKTPINFKPIKNRIYTKAIFSSTIFERNNYTNNGELLIPAPYGFKPKKRVGKRMHFFNGIQSEMPTIFGIIKEIDPINGKDFAKMIRNSKLNSFKNFKEIDAEYNLSRVEKVNIEKPMGMHFMEKTGIGGIKIELRIHKIIFGR